MPKRWNVDTILGYLSEAGAELGEDNDGQLVLYTGLRVVNDHTLEVMDTGEYLTGGRHYVVPNDEGNYEPFERRISPE